MAAVKNDNYKKSVITFFITDIYKRYNNHYIAQNGAQIAFFFLLSVFPFVIFFNAIIGFFNLSIEKVIADISPYLPYRVINLLITYISYMSENIHLNLLPIGIITNLYSASGMVRSLTSCINIAYNVKQHRSFATIILLSMAFTLISAIITVLTVFLIALGNDLIKRAISYFNVPDSAASLVYYSGWSITILILFFGISLMYYSLPNKKVTFKSILPGSIFCLAGFLVLTVGLSLYSNYMLKFSAYSGSIGAILVILLWVYFLCIIILLGAELNSAVEVFVNQKKAKKLYKKS